MYVEQIPDRFASPMGLRILYVSTLFPYPAHRGGKIRISNILRRLNRRHDVYFVSLSADHTGEIDALRARAEDVCTDVQVIPHRKRRWRGGLRSVLHREPYEVGLFRNEDMERAVERAISEVDPDLVWCSRLASLQYLPDDVSATLLLDQHDLSSRLWETMQNRAAKWWVQAYARYNRALVERYERDVYEDLDICVSVSEEERRLTADFAPANTSLLVAPNGVDVSYFQPSGEYPEEEGALVSVGSMDQTRNVDASRFFVDEVLPRLRDRGLDVTYYIVGQNPTDEVRRMGTHPAVEVTGTVDDVRPFLERSSVVVAPYRMGSGVKHKVPIAFAMGAPVVATPNACHGLGVISGEHVRVAEEADAFADAVQDLLQSREERRAMGARAQQYIRTEYSWDAILDDLLREVEALVKGEDGSEFGQEEPGEQLFARGSALESARSE